MRILPAGTGSLVQSPNPVAPTLPSPHPYLPSSLPNCDGQFEIDTKAQPVEVLISDASIFNGQTAFRRAELLPASNDGADAST